MLVAQSWICNFRVFWYVERSRNCYRGCRLIKSLHVELCLHDIYLCNAICSVRWHLYSWSWSCNSGGVWSTKNSWNYFKHGCRLVKSLHIELCSHDVYLCNAIFFVVDTCMLSRQVVTLGDFDLPNRVETIILDVVSSHWAMFTRYTLV